MKRYIKVKHRWIDTLIEQKHGNYYYVIDGRVYCLTDEERYIGNLSAQTDDLTSEKQESIYL